MSRAFLYPLLSLLPLYQRGLGGFLMKLIVNFVNNATSIIKIFPPLYPLKELKINPPSPFYKKGDVFLKDK